ncbi:hypothetical protein Tco_0603021 [Tanacetum coccineum]
MGNSKKRVTKGKDGVYRVLPPSTQTEQVADEKERKARTLLLMAVPKDHLRRFHGMDDAKEIWDAIKTRKSLEKGYDRFKTSITVGWPWLILYNNIVSLKKTFNRTSSSFFTSDNVAFLSQAKASSSMLCQCELKRKPDDHDEGNIIWVEKTTDGNSIMLYWISCGIMMYIVAQMFSIGLGYSIKSNAEVLSYEEEMDRGIFARIRETDPGYHDIPLYSRFKQVEYKDMDLNLTTPSPTVSNSSPFVSQSVIQ